MWGFSECRAVSQLLWNYTANRLNAEETELVERHLAKCGACRAEADAYRQTVNALATMRGDGIPQSRRGWHELQARLSEPEARPAPSRVRWGLPPLAWGSFAALACAVAVMFFSNQQPMINGTVGARSGASGTETATNTTSAS